MRKAHTPLIFISKIQLLFLGFLCLATSRGYCDDTAPQDPAPQPTASQTPQEATTNVTIQTPEGLLNQMPVNPIGNMPLNQAGIYQNGGSLLVDRDVNMPHVLAISSVTVSSENVTGSLQVPNGVNAGDAAAFGQLPVFKVVCSSITNTAKSLSGTAFLPTFLGCSGALTNSSHHALVISNAIITQNTSGQSTIAAMFVDSVNQDDATDGQCEAVVAATGFSGVESNCPAMLYYAPNDTSSHSYNVRARLTGGAGNFGIGTSTQRLVVMEVP